MSKLKILFLFFLFTFITQNLISQVSSRSRRPTTTQQKKEKESFADHLWYGGGFGLSFSSGSTNLTGNTFSLSLAPMVGYKFNNVFSMGPRVEVTYTSGRFQQFPGSSVSKYNGIDYGIGAFARAKFLPFLFAHTELTYLNQVYPTGFGTNNKITTSRQGDNKFYAGLGYTSGGVFRSEVYLLYDVFYNNPNSTQLPLVYRFGFTYNF